MMEQNIINLKKHLTLRNLWIFGLLSLISFNILAVIVVSEQTCGKPFVPILLSRALTTDPWRGFTLSYCLFAISGSFTFNSSVLTTAFFGFFAAFLVSMFDTPASHDLLIATSGLLVMYETVPTPWGKNLWVYHWLTIVALGSVFFGWMVYAKMNYTEQEEKCSWFYIVEYLCFWGMNALVLWMIEYGEYVSDAICVEGQELQTNRKIRVVQNIENINNENNENIENIEKQPLILF